MWLVTPLFVWKVLCDIEQEHAAEGNSDLRSLEKMKSPKEIGLLYTCVCPPSLHLHTPSNTRCRGRASQDLLFVKYLHFHAKFSKLPPQDSNVLCWGLLRKATEWLQFSTQHHPLFKIRRFMPSAKRKSRLFNTHILWKSMPLFKCMYTWPINQ